MRGQRQLKGNAFEFVSGDHLEYTYVVSGHFQNSSSGWVDFFQLIRS